MKVWMLAETMVAGKVLEVRAIPCVDRRTCMRELHASVRTRIAQHYENSKNKDQCVARDVGGILADWTPDGARGARAYEFNGVGRYIKWRCYPCWVSGSPARRRSCPFCGKEPVEEALCEGVVVRCMNPDCPVRPCTRPQADSGRAHAAWSARVNANSPLSIARSDRMEPKAPTRKRGGRAHV